jgi:TRAP-type C4-dicarboxylate transport system substrate-binding protein
MIKEFLMKKMMASQLKGLPKDQQELILKAIEKNPKLFEKIAKETEDEVKKGKNQMYAAFEVMKKYQKELQEVIKN